MFTEELITLSRRTTSSMGAADVDAAAATGATVGCWSALRSSASHVMGCGLDSTTSILYAVMLTLGSAPTSPNRLQLLLNSLPSAGNFTVACSALAAASTRMDTSSRF